MRKIVVRSTSKTLTHKDLWNRITTLEEYPDWCKYCIKMMPTKLEVGAIYHDITTLLWIPLKIKHQIIKIEPHKEFHLFLPLPGRGKMWVENKFAQEGNIGVLETEVRFDLGNRFFNATVGHVLEKRWMNLIRQGFPGLDEKKRL